MDRKPPHPETVGHCVGMLHRFARKLMTRLLEPMGLPEVAFPLLAIVSHHDAISQDELAEIHMVDKSTVARALMRMEDAGLVTRSVDPDDRRIKRVEATADGRCLVERLGHALHEWDERLLEGLTAEEQSAALRFLQHMARNAHSHWDDLPDEPVVTLTMHEDE